ncbi:TRP-domain-containing protein [Punctularia strigosozonata HHB-11173 SS5]|uniref:TRP-domain-containing protein n=1 Tax=Punctularia strigosozonata (strain HHB-11173) TaxID=741275 RepID=UPI0004416C49|nr:TRP-domain-containing protein [Punctularia strigosozonata HHB-11173 SS5]EIN11323.1 TRP-domain-containing protein [Punctularia strigosozonata HHB-11173 SS5]
MFSVARLRRFLPFLLLSAPAVAAREESLFTSSVTYCEPPESLLVQRFDVAYFASNNSISFNISAASVVSNLNVSANLFVNVYGMHPVNVTIDLCSILDGLLCPLPTYNFTGATSIPLPSSVDVASNLPGIAYKIPDLEAFVQLTLLETTTQDVVACVQATLSNGWSTHQTAVEWATGALAILALIPSIFQSLLPEALLPFRLVELMFLFQSIAATALLSLNYPLVYRSYATNFAWAMGLYPSHSIQKAINNLRSATGGHVTNGDTGDSVGFVNRKLSPFNVGQDNFVLSSGIGTISQFGKRAVATVTAGSSNVLQAGIPVYVNARRIATANAFDSIFITALIAIVITLACFGFGYLILRLLARSSRQGSNAAAEVEDRYPSIIKSWSLRVALISFLPVTIFAFYQWTLSDSWLSILLSVFLIAWVFAGVFWAAFATLRLARSEGPLALHSHTEHLRSYGPLYAIYRAERWFFSFPLLFAALAKSAVIAFGHGHGQTQLIFLIAIELLVLVSTIAAKPQKTRRSDVFATFFAVVRFVCAGLMIAFIESIAVDAIPRVAIGIVIAVIFSVAVVVMFFNIVWNMIDVVFRRRRASSEQSTPVGSILEKQSNRSLPPASLAGLEDGLGSLRNARMEDDLDTLPNTPTTATHSQRHSAAQEMTYARGSYAPQRERWSHAHTSSSGSASSQLPLSRA